MSPRADNTRHLIPVTQRTKEEARAIQSKGGRSKSPAKQRAARINGLLQKKNLTRYDAQVLEFFQNKDMQGLIDALIQRLIIEYKDDPKVISDAVNKLQAQLPKVNVNLNLTNEKDFMSVVINVLQSRSEWETAIPVIRERLGGKK